LRYEPSFKRVETTSNIHVLRLRGKGVTLAFVHKPFGYLIVVADDGGRRLGYAVLPDEDLCELVNLRGEWLKWRNLQKRETSQAKQI